MSGLSIRTLIDLVEKEDRGKEKSNYKNALKMLSKSHKLPEDADIVELLDMVVEDPDTFIAAENMPSTWNTAATYYMNFNTFMKLTKFRYVAEHVCAERGEEFNTTLGNILTELVSKYNIATKDAPKRAYKRKEKVVDIASISESSEICAEDLVDSPVSPVVETPDPVSNMADACKVVSLEERVRVLEAEVLEGKELRMLVKELMSMWRSEGGGGTKVYNFH